MLCRVLTVCNFFDTHRGGLDIVAGTLAREFARRGLSVHWLATAETAVPVFDTDGPVVAVPVHAWNFLERRFGIPFPLPHPSAIAKLAKEVQAADAILLHDSLYPLSVATMLLARLARKPIVILQHIGEVPYRHPLLRFLMKAANMLVARNMLAVADQVVYISAGVSRFFEGVKYRRAPVIIFNGVDVELFNLGIEGHREKYRNEFGIDATAKVVLFAGRFVEKKGLHFLEMLAVQNKDLLWILAGSGHIDPNSWHLSNVRVFHALDRISMSRLYQSADAFVLPSQGEGFPLVVQEALACGLPVVAGLDSATADVAAERYIFGVEIDTDDPATTTAALGKAVREVLEAERGDPRRRKTRHEFVRERYSWAVAANRYIELLRMLIPQPTAGTKDSGSTHDQ